MNRVLFGLSLLLITVLAAEAQTGQSVFGEKKYIEYIPGDLPVVISAPHGGREEPAEIPGREKGVVQADADTQELARAVAEEMVARTGHRPYLIICRLHRKKLDCNREVQEAAAGDPIATKAWTEYHAFIEQALKAASKEGRAFFIDLHGQSHPDPHIELGYLHSEETLGKSDEELNAPAIVAAGSIRLLAKTSKLSYVELLRGPHSLGALLEARGFPTTPSPARPVPKVPYFQGGYTVRRHASGEGPVSGLQIETNRDGLRDTDANRTKFAVALVAALREYLGDQFNLRLPVK